ncbi:cytochrome P450 [Nonomuraea sp. H19]|uniref:cytochrome P450 n=1 Tax=Nonomuraea sp. H19 TaxID=3452206 RepID=UPI003F898AEF
MADLKPSDFPRDPRFRTPGRAFIEDGVAHLRSYQDVRRVMLDGTAEEEFSRDVSYWLPQGQRLHATWSFVWGVGYSHANGTPGRYDALRGIFEPHFTKDVVRRLESTIRGHARNLVDSIVEKGTGEFNLATELAYPLALRTNCSLVGIPAEHRPWLVDQLYSVIRTPRGGLGDREPPEVEAYLWELIREREDHPGEELLDLLIAARRSGTITGLELIGSIWSLSQSAVEDAGTNTANAFALLGEFGLLGEARQKVDDDNWLHWAGEEILRYGTPFPSRPLVAITDVVLEDDVRVPAMTPVRLWLSAANRDAAVNGGNSSAASPDLFDVTRSPNRHLTFGVGTRMCMAARMARLQARIALQEALPRLPELELDLKRPFERHAGITDGVLHAHFQFDQWQAERFATA